MPSANSGGRGRCPGHLGEGDAAYDVGRNPLPARLGFHGSSGSRQGLGPRPERPGRIGEGVQPRFHRRRESRRLSRVPRRRRGRVPPASGPRPKVLRRSARDPRHPEPGARLRRGLDRGRPRLHRRSVAARDGGRQDPGHGLRRVRLDVAQADRRLVASRGRSRQRASQARHPPRGRELPRPHELEPPDDGGPPGRPGLPHRRRPRDRPHVGLARDPAGLRGRRQRRHPDLSPQRPARDRPGRRALDAGSGAGGTMVRRTMFAISRAPGTSANTWGLVFVYARADEQRGASRHQRLHQDLRKGATRRCGSHSTSWRRPVADRYARP